jgi:hypothetical protein
MKGRWAYAALIVGTVVISTYFIALIVEGGR